MFGAAITHPFKLIKYRYQNNTLLPGHDISVLHAWFALEASGNGTTVRKLLLSCVHGANKQADDLRGIDLRRGRWRE